jgi:hypothetical protein
MRGFILSAQLPAIGPGGMFDRVAERTSAQLHDIHRTRDSEEQEAWQALRAGEPERAMAHYHDKGQLHLNDTRDQAAEQAVQHWHTLTQQHSISQVALIADASNQEIHVGQHPAQVASGPKPAETSAGG